MADWISDLLIFSAGIAGGVLITTMMPYLFAGKRRHTQMVAARVRMLADLKEKHDEEILDQAFRTAEAIRGELDQSLITLKKTLNIVLPLNGAPEKEPRMQVIQLTDPVKPS